MRKLAKQRMISFVLALAVFISAIPVEIAGAGSFETSTVRILHQGKETAALTLLEDGKETLYVDTTLSGDIKYAWQIKTNADSWVAVKGCHKDFCDVSYALIGSLLDAGGTAWLRCVAAVGNHTFYSEPVAVTVSFQAKSSYASTAATGGEARPLVLRANRSGAAAAADETPDSHTIIINYKYTDGTAAYDPTVLSIEDGGYVNYAFNSPVIIGYTPVRMMDGAYTDAATISIYYEALHEDVAIDVIYMPAEVQYTVNHYLQNVMDDHYELAYTTTGKQLTGFQVPDCSMDISGFSALYYEKLTVAADGSTVIDIYYDRNYYLIDFNLDGGYGMEPVYTRYGSSISAHQPTKAGYTFSAWELLEFDGRAAAEEEKSTYDINGRQITVPCANLTYKAGWLQGASSYTVVYWKENADDNGYSYWAHQTISEHVKSGDLVSGGDTVAGLVEDAAYFTYNDAKTDKNVMVEGDGSTVVNVYYTRNIYTVYFTGISGTCAIEEHTHGIHCNSQLICTLEEHIHDAHCKKILSCGQAEHLTHVEDCLICGKAAHNHAEAGCAVVCGQESHTHSKACYADVGDETLSGTIGKPANPAEGQVYKGFLNTYIYIKGTWYDYTGSLASGTIAPTICEKEENTHLHTDSCYACGLVNHSHEETCYQDQLHSHTEACYTYLCGKEAHTHSGGCYSECTLLTHTHSSLCSQNSDRNVIYVVSAKYEATIGEIWPTAAEFPAIRLRGWDIDGVSSTAVSKRINMTTDLCDTSDRLKYAEAVEGGSETTLHYMFESFDQTSPAGGNERILRNGVYYDQSPLYSQQVYSSGNWNQKEIMGMQPVSGGVEESGNNVFLYYMRAHYTLSFVNVNATVKTVENILYEYPMAEFEYQNGELYEPAYPSTYEPNAYEFKGWYTTPQCFAGTEYDFAHEQMPAGDLALYAKWAPVTHRVTVYKDATKSEQIGNVQYIPHGNTAAAPDTVENGNYIFAGWFYLDESGSEKAFIFNSMPINQDLEIYAKWSSKVAVKYEVYFKLLGTDIEIADPMIGSTLAGMNKTFSAKGGSDLYAGYQESYFPTVNSHTVTMSLEQDNIYTFWYVAVESVPYTVQYINAKTGESLADDKIVSENKKAVVTEKFLPIPGYMPDAYQKRLVVQSEGENILTFFYTKDDQHSYYRIVYYIQNLDRTGYEEYRSIESVGILGELYKADANAISIAGFAFNAGYTEAHSEATAVTGTTVSGRLTADGLLIELFFDRTEVEYTVRHLEYGTNRPLTEPTGGTGYYGQQISGSSVRIPGYSLVGTETTKSILLAATAARNVITFYYQEQYVPLRYIPLGGGTVSLGAENVLAYSGTPAGSVPTANQGYRFVGWFLNESCTVPVNTDWVGGDGKITPQKNNGLFEEKTYYAKFVADKASLTIIKTGDYDAYQEIDPHQTFLFRVTGAETDITVTIHGNGTATLVDLPVGRYVVKEISDWSWRYKPGQDIREIVISPDGENNVSFQNTRTEEKWLDGDSFKVNIFSKSTD